MNILFCVSEIAHLYQLGGLGDVAYSLPKALREKQLDARVALPFHGSITPDSSWQNIDTFEVLFNQHQEKVEVWQGMVPQSDTPIYLFKNLTYLSLPSGVADDAMDKFAFFSLAICQWLLHSTSWQPDIIHCNDWHTALVPVILKHRYQTSNYKTLLTIHNLNFQGIAGIDIIRKLAIEPGNCQILQWDGQNNDLNLLMEGMIHADWVNAVSPTYATEIMTPEYGAFLDPVTNSIKGKVSGILNGIDYDLWNCQTDPFIANCFTHDSLESGKQTNKSTLLTELEIPQTEKPLFAYIGRIDGAQKGIQLIIEAIRRSALGTDNRPFIFLGTGDSDLEQELVTLTKNNPYCKVICRFDVPLSHRIYAGSDFMLIPSKYEPCGLVQMIAMRYATVPIVRQTGGLADSVWDGKTGLVFNAYSAEAMMSVLDRAIDIFKANTHYNEMRQACLNTDFSWYQSANTYIKLYHQLLVL